MHVEDMLQAAIQHHEAGRLVPAETAYRKVLEADPRNVDALHFLGFLLSQRGECAGAIDFIARSLALNASNPPALVNLGNAYQAAGDAARARDCFQKAVALQSDAYPTHYNLGLALLALGEREPAAASFREAIRLNPGFAEAHFYLGNMFCDDDRIEEGLGYLRRAIELRPEYAEAHWTLALACLPQVFATGEDPTRARREMASGLERLERWFAPPERAAAGAAAVGTMQPFSLAYQENPNRPLLERHGRLCSRLMGVWLDQHAPAPTTAHRTARGGPIRVGIVSAHLRDHSVWHAIVRGWFQHLDAARFRICAFNLGGEDEETRIARTHAAHFESGPKSLRGWVDAIREQRPDVLIYPEIGMHPIALRLASMRLAQVQACSWGHPETSGLPTIDYYFSAEGLEPSNAQENYSEKLVMLPHLGCSFEPRAAPGARPQLSELGLAADRPLLVCPGVPFKYAPQHDWIYPELALRLGRCRFVFFRHALSDRLRERLQDAFRARGLDAERFVVFLPWLTKAGFLGVLSQAQVCLDTIGFSGFNTALQAVQAGVPLVSREGRFLRGRLGSGILKRIGLPELVTASEADYLALVERIVREPGLRRDLAARIEDGRHALFADQAAIRGLEQALERAVSAAQG